MAIAHACPKPELAKIASAIVAILKLCAIQAQECTALQRFEPRTFT